MIFCIIDKLIYQVAIIAVLSQSIATKPYGSTGLFIADYRIIAIIGSDPIKEW